MLVFLLLLQQDEGHACPRVRSSFSNVRRIHEKYLTQLYIGAKKQGFLSAKDNAGEAEFYVTTMDKAYDTYKDTVFLLADGPCSPPSGGYTEVAIIKASSFNGQQWNGLYLRVNLTTSRMGFVQHKAVGSEAKVLRQMGGCWIREGEEIQPGLYRETLADSQTRRHLKAVSGRQTLALARVRESKRYRRKSKTCDKDCRADFEFYVCRDGRTGLCW